MATTRFPKEKEQLVKPKPYYPPVYDDGGFTRFLGCGGMVLLLIGFIILMNLPK